MSTPAPRRRTSRFSFFVLFILLALFLFAGGAAAILYYLFSEYSGIRALWILICGAPVILMVFVFLIIFHLYTRYGRPLRRLFDAINAVEAGDLSVRVPEDRSDVFNDLLKHFNNMVVELERAEHQRRNLSADIAHEIRTPLHIIQGNLEGVLDGVYQPTNEHIRDTLDETRLLTRLADDLQTLSLAETGHLPLHPTQFLLADLIEDVETSFASQASALGIDLRLHIANPLLEITADYDRLNQVLSNLLSNAIRHTPSGGTVSIETGQGSSAERGVRIMVKDTGTGIAEEDLPFIFDRFWRGDRSRQERTHSGLGLAITKQLIHAHNGVIEVRSAFRKGSTFIIEIPTHP